MATPFELEDPPQQLVDQIDLIGKQLVRLQFVTRLGFLAINGNYGGIHIVAFHSDQEDRDHILPVANLRERPRQNHQLDDNAKGLGIMVGNSMESISYPSKQERSHRYHGVWMTPELLPEDIVDVRFKDMPDVLINIIGIGRHAYLKAVAQVHDTCSRLEGVDSEEAKLRGIEMAIKSIERRYGQSALAVINPAPTWLNDQRHHGIQHIVPPVWGVYRDHTQALTRIGSATAQHATQESESDDTHKIVTLPYNDRLAAARPVS